MRDALSIMDQAIASAPVENDRPVLSAAQIRELMGSVPNAVFERLLEAVAAGQSAELMEQLNLLLNAGHSPSSLARQMVRYLRNTLMAKLGGAETELLQISGDERARAARTALLFTEEELTRNLQIVLRTFDDLNYRQEQRFHLELGLLKLIHAQRLLPIEELLSGSRLRVRTLPGLPRRRYRLHGQPPAPRARPHPPHRQPLRRFRPLARRRAAVGVRSPAWFQPFAEFRAARPEVRWPLEWHPASTLDAAASPAVTTGASACPRSGNCGRQRTPRPAALASKLRRSPRPRQALPASNPFATPSAPRWPRPVTSRPRSCWAQARGRSMVPSLRIEVAGMGKKMLALTVNAAAEKIITPGAATAGRAHTLSGHSRRRRRPETGQSARPWQRRQPAAYRRPRSPIRSFKARRRFSRPRSAASSISAKNKFTLQINAPNVRKNKP